MAQDFSKHIYLSEKWQRLRLQLVAESNGICGECGGSFASEYLRVHHKTDLNEFNIKDAEIVYGRDNLQVVCAGCHNRIHNRASGRHEINRPERNVYIVAGAPMSGKTTYVNDIATPYDLIVDMDKLFNATSINSMYEKPSELFPAVAAARDALYDIIQTRGGKHHNSYIITGRRLIELERLCRQMSAELIIIESTQEECMERLKTDRSGRDKQKWAGYIASWFDENKDFKQNIPPA